MPRTHQRTRRPRENSFGPRGSLIRSRFCTAILFALALFSASGPAAAALLPSPVPRADHVLVVVMENHSYDQVRYLPYTSGLIATESSFSSSYGVTHPSQPNYLAFWSGGTQGVSNDQCPSPGSPYGTPNLGQGCEGAGLSWRSYCENLPSAGYTGCSAGGGLYVRRHAPWTNFSNLNHANERPYGDLAIDIANGTLPDLAVVIPNLCNDTHDCPVSVGDAWLAAHLPGLIDAVGPYGLVILTWDEDDDYSGNHILTLFAGPMVKSGYVSPGHITHYTVLRTLCDALGISPFGAARYETPISDVWNDASAVPAPGRAIAPALGTARPNPSTGGFEAEIFVRQPAPVEAAVYDAGGRRIALLLREEMSGGRTLRWDGRRFDGRPAPGGIYFLRARAGGAVEERTLVLLGHGSR